MHLCDQQRSTSTVFTLLLWTARISLSRATAVGMMRGLSVNNKCSTPEQQKGSFCQSVCRCECDEYWNLDSQLCSDACKALDYKSPVDVLSWCQDYNVVEYCDETPMKFSDKWSGKWKDSTIEAEMDITYMRAYGREFKLNFFTDTNRTVEEPLPLALVIHGGGFNSGSKNTCKRIEDAIEVASRGYRTIAINYPMCGTYWSYVDPEASVPEFGTVEGSGWHAWDADEPLYLPAIGQQDDQCKWGGAHKSAHPEQYKQAAEVVNLAGRHAIKFAHDRSQEWGIDVDQTICIGTSAGAISCYEMLLFNTTVKYKQNVTGLPSLPELDELKVDVAAGRAGALTFPKGRNVTQETVDAMSPLAAVYNLHGVNDPVVPIDGARLFMDILEEYHVPHYLREVEGQGHSLEEWQFDVSHPERLDEMFDFVAEHLTNPPSCDDLDKQQCEGTDGCTFVKKPKKIRECVNKKANTYPEYDCPSLSSSKKECKKLKDENGKKVCKSRKVDNPNLGCRPESLPGQSEFKMSS